MTGTEPVRRTPAVADRGADRRSEPGPVAYLVKMFPRLSESFILNELRELHRCGVPVRIVSLMRPTGSVQAPEAGPLARDAFYVPSPWGRPSPGDGGWRETWTAHRALFRGHPGRYTRTLLLALRRGSFAALKRFGQAGPVARFCLEENVSHLHAGFAHTPTSVAFWAARLTGLNYSFAAHAKDLYLSDPKSLRRKIDGARFVLTCTEANGAFLKGLGGRTPIHVRHHGCDLEAYTRRGRDGNGLWSWLDQVRSGGADACSGTRADGRAQADARPPRILAVGRLVPKKGFADLLEAVALLRDRGAGFELVFAGDGPLKGALAKQVEALGLSARVRFAGSLRPEQVRVEYERADLVVLPSVVLESGDRDGVPNVLVEAMAMGVPVVSTRVSAIPELIRDRETGLLVSPHAPFELADAIGSVLGDPEEAARRAVRARTDVRRRFDLRRNSELVVGLLDRHRRPSRAIYVSSDFGVPVRGHKGASAHVRQESKPSSCHRPPARPSPRGTASTFLSS